uniref:MFS domain-containing protein n=1 Tax=Panagrellus redivivus TaxID=6233 RepID=A0A7E4W1E6_PANRE
MGSRLTATFPLGEKPAVPFSWVLRGRGLSNLVGLVFVNHGQDRMDKGAGNRLGSATLLYCTLVGAAKVVGGGIIYPLIMLIYDSYITIFMIS